MKPTYSYLCSLSKVESLTWCFLSRRLTSNENPGFHDFHAPHHKKQTVEKHTSIYHHIVYICAKTSVDMYSQTEQLNAGSLFWGCFWRNPPSYVQVRWFEVRMVASSIAAAFLSFKPRGAPYSLAKGGNASYEASAPKSQPLKRFLIKTRFSRTRFSTRSCA